VSKPDVSKSSRAVSRCARGNQIKRTNQGYSSLRPPSGRCGSGVHVGRLQMHKKWIRNQEPRNSFNQGSAYSQSTSLSSMRPTNRPSYDQRQILKSFPQEANWEFSNLTRHCKKEEHTQTLAGSPRNSAPESNNRYLYRSFVFSQRLDERAVLQTPNL
jgi:hypothetical protein